MGIASNGGGDGDGDTDGRAPCWRHAQVKRKKEGRQRTV